MSIDFRPLAAIRMADLFDGRLKDVGVREHDSKNATVNHKILTDGRNVLWVDGNEKGLVSSFSSYGMNAPHHILQAIGEVFGVGIVSEHEPEFWGYETEEEWQAAWARDGKKFVRGESHNIKPGTVGMTQAEIAKRLIAESPYLLAEDKRDLIKAIELIYDRDHGEGDIDR